ncbi:MAG: DUF2268 domain-containing putative Zn-dependent protease [Meiothermus sp.]|nr:DUF2268 domain-containing putative Zn-dependent protease [Meiothermus sp.]
MTVQPINALAGQRAALEANSMEVFRARVMEPLADFWRPAMARMPQAQADADPALAVGQMWGFYSPQDGLEEGLRAIAEFEAAQTHLRCVEAVQRGWELLAPERHGLQLPPVKFAFLLGSLRVLRPEYGAYTGAQVPGFAMVMGWPDPVGTPRLPVAAAHELNHIVRFAAEPTDWAHYTVGQYVVLEGLAESFGVEVAGDKSLVGPYSAALSSPQLEAVRPTYREALEATGDIRGYIFGDWAAEQFGYTRRGLPDYAGYSLGYALVQAYLRRSGKTAAEATYVPWREIVEQSGYLE